MKKVDSIPVAQRKAEKRGIKIVWIEDAVNSPTQIVKGYGGRKVAHKMVSIDDKEYLLRVVYEEAFTVVTAYITSKVDRYWSK